MPSFLFIAFVGIQSVFIDDFHEVSLLPVSIAWLFYFLEKKRWRSYFVALFLCLSVREHIGFLLSVLATYIYFSSKNIKVALSTFMVSLLWSFLAIKVFMPSFGKVDYSSFVTPGDSLFSASMDYLLNPLSIARNLFYPLVKIKTIVFSFLSFGLLPLLDLKLLPIIGFQFAYRFLDIQHPIRSTLFYHFSVELAVLMSISTISVLEKLTKIVKARRFFFMFGLVIITLNTIINIYLNAPVLTLLKSNFYADEPWMKDNKLILSKIPKDQSVSAQNNLVPHLSHREKIYVLPIVEDAQYIVFDLHPNQDNWNFYTLSPELAKNKLKELIKSGSYKIAFSSNYSFLLEKMPSPTD